MLTVLFLWSEWSQIINGLSHKTELPSQWGPIGISQKIIFLLKNRYDRVVSAVKVNNGLNFFFQPLIVVRQGCNLSPTLFNLFINDIVDLFDSSCEPLHMTCRWPNYLPIIRRWSNSSFSIGKWFTEMPWYIVMLRNGKWKSISRRLISLFLTTVVKYSEENSNNQYK